MPPTVQNLLAGAFVTEKRRGAGHVGTDRDGPDGQLIPRQQVAGERQQEREQQQDDADHPVELARRFVTAGEKHAIHVEPGRDDHGVGAPAMQLAHDAETDRTSRRS